MLNPLFTDAYGDGLRLAGSRSKACHRWGIRTGSGDVPRSISVPVNCEMTEEVTAIRRLLRYSSSARRGPAHDGLS
jgi:hypothetical protein